MKIYISPIYLDKKNHTGNDYLKYFTDSFSLHGWKICKRFPSLGILNIIFNLDARIFCFHWVDSITKRKYGVIQFMFFLFYLILLFFLNKKIVWILHNKTSHSGNSFFVKIGYKCISLFSYLIITHSKSGIDFIKDKYKHASQKVFYIPHPVYTNIIKKDNSAYKWDYIIWGGIEPRKGILDFLIYYHNNSICFDNAKILICGRCNDLEYARQIESYCDCNITFINKFLEEDKLTYYINQSRNILFTYSSESTLSSGALIYSLNYLKPILGPKVGSFMEFPGIVTCYNSFNDLLNINIDFNKGAVLDYITNNTWNSFVEKFENLLIK